MIQTEGNLIDYFRKKQAISPSRAIEFDSNEFEKINTAYLKTPINISKSPYIKTTTVGKFFLDEQALQDYRNKTKKFGLYLLIFLIILFVFGIIIRIFFL